MRVTRCRGWDLPPRRWHSDPQIPRGLLSHYLIYLTRNMNKFERHSRHPADQTDIA